MATPPQEDTLRIRGGRPISGVFVPSGNKNEALPAVAAALLASSPVTLRNVPEIDDVKVMIELASRIGAGVTYGVDGSLIIDPRSVCSTEPHAELARRIRGSFLFTAPLLARLSRARLPRPGGDKIGRRRIDTHLEALRNLGARLDIAEDHYTLELDGRFRGANIFLDEASVMATENSVMAASVAEGETRIENAACEPHVQGLCRMLNAMGARIRGVGTNVLDIEGVPELGGAEHRIGPDHIEIGSLIGLAAVTGGELSVPGVRAADLRMMKLVFARLGVQIELQDDRLFVAGGQELKIIADVHDAIPKIDDAPWPGFPADLMSIAVIVATQCEGTILIHEKMFESRLFFVDRLISMGAKIILCDPHRAVVVGPSKLHAERITSPDIRAGMAMLIAALCADGESVVQNVLQIDRGYTRIDERLRALGADIRRE